MARYIDKYRTTGPSTTVSIRVRYAHIDAMGYAYHGHFVSWFETARTELLRTVGYSYRELEQDGYILPVHCVQVTYHYPAAYDDELLVTATLKYMSKLQMDFAYHVRRKGDNQLIAEGSTRIFCTDREGRPTQIPDHIRNLAIR